MPSPVPADFSDSISADNADMIIIYDGQCPFCTNYVRLVRLQASIGTIKLVDARDVNLARVIHQKLGLDLNEGMLVIYGGNAYYGAEAVHFLSLMSEGNGFWNQLMARIFRIKPVATALYPLLKLGRAIALKALGRKNITLE